MDDGLLITLIQQYNELYNLKNKDYSNQQRRQNIWDAIGQILKQPGNACKERWVRIRDNHRKALKLRQTKSGQAATNMKPPKFSKELTFLVPYLFEDEDRIANIPALEKTQNSENEINEAIVETSLDSCSEVQSLNTNAFEIAETTPRVTSNRKSKKPAPSSSYNSVASVFHDYLNKKQKTGSASEDPITNFFLSMAQTVKTFPLTDQIEIKKNLFKNVSEVEMRIACNTANKPANSSANNPNNNLPQVLARQYYNDVASSLSFSQQEEDNQQESTYINL